MDARLPIDSLSSVSSSASALARRRMLLAGLGKGSAALALVVPIQTLAVTTIVGGTKLCTVSGVQSNVGSHPLGAPTTCQGNSPTYFGTLANWPGYDSASNPPKASFTVNGVIFTNSSKFSDVFGSGVGTSLDTVVKTTSDNSVWVTAWLNAVKNRFNFPYTPSQVVAFYTNPDVALKARALAFFRDYMQTVTT